MQLNITDRDPLSGFAAYRGSLLLGAEFVVPLVAFVTLVGVAAWLGRRSRVVPAIALSVAGYAAIHVWSVLYGWLAFACLAIGVVIWAMVLRHHWAHEQTVPETGRASPG